MFRTGDPSPKPSDKDPIIPTPEPGTMAEDLEQSMNRDDTYIYKFGPHVNVEFEEIFAESIDYQQSQLGISVGSRVNHGCLRNVFDTCNSCTFYVLSVLIGWLSVIVCGLIYGINMAFQIWCIQPCIKLVFTWLRLCFACNRAYVRACMDPIFQSLGQTFAYIRGQFYTEVSDAKPTPTKPVNYGALEDGKEAED